MAIAFSHTLLFFMAVAASAQDDSTVFLQRMQAVHFEPDQDATVERQVDRAPPRRIQYLFEWKGGLGDRLSSFTFLNNLAHVHNATAHIPGGRLSARRHLTSKHSAVIAEDWGTYFNTAAHNGNPFHPADENATGCKTIASAPASWYHIFDDGGHCVNIVLDLHNTQGLPIELFNYRHIPWPSATVGRLTGQALEQAGARPFEFGYLHIRRCDLLHASAKCTDPEKVKALVAASNETTWLVFSYAEIGYLDALKNQLQVLPDRRFVYEEDLRIEVAGDNYLLYASTLVLRALARSSMDLKRCSNVQKFTMLLESDILEHRGVCRGGDAHGPQTLQPWGRG